MSMGPEHEVNSLRENPGEGNQNAVRIDNIIKFPPVLRRKIEAHAEEKGIKVGLALGTVLGWTHGHAIAGSAGFLVEIALSVSLGYLAAKGYTYIRTRNL